MEARDSDERIRALYRRLGPEVDTDAFMQALESHLGRPTSQPERRCVLRRVFFSCAAFVLVLGIGLGLYLSLSHLAQPRQVLVIGDAATGTEGPSSTVEPLLTNPYPAYQVGSGSGVPTKSAWGEQLGRAVLSLYPGKDWQVLDAVESSLLTRVVIGPCQADPRTSSADDPVPWLEIDVAREERYTSDKQEYLLPHEEFATDYGHGLITAHYGPDDSSIVSWFVRPDGLYIQVAAVQAGGDHTQPATLLLGEEDVQELTETIAAMIKMGSPTTTTSTLPPR